MQKTGCIPKNLFDCTYIFKQAHNDRLEDAGIKKYRHQHNEGYLVEIREQPERKPLSQRMKQVILAVAHLQVK